MKLEKYISPVEADFRTTNRSASVGLISGSAYSNEYPSALVLYCKVKASQPGFCVYPEITKCPIHVAVDCHEPSPPSPHLPSFYLPTSRCERHVRKPPRNACVHFQHALAVSTTTATLDAPNLCESQLNFTLCLNSVCILLSFCLNFVEIQTLFSNTHTLFILCSPSRVTKHLVDNLFSTDL